MLNILFVNYYPSDVGGASFSTRILIEALKKRGHKVIIVSTAEYPGIETIVMRDVQKIPLFFLRDRYLEKFLSSIISKYNIDIIHSADGRFTVAGTVKAAKKNGIASVIHFRDFWFMCLKGTLMNEKYDLCDGLNVSKCFKCIDKQRFFIEFYKYLYFRKKIKIINKADAIIGVSNCVKRYLLSVGVKNKVEVVHNPVAIEQGNEVSVPKELTEKLRLYRDSKVVMYIGRIIEHKGMDIILGIAEKFLMLDKTVKFLIIGDGEMMEKCRAYSREKKLSNIVWFGSIPHSDISEVYKVTDIMMLPSLCPDTFSRSVIESMSYGKPVVASKIGGNVEIITHNSNGFLVDPKDVEEYSNVILKLFADKELYQKISLGALARVKKISSDIVAQEVELIYSEIKK